LRSVPASESVAVAAQVPIGLSRISEQILPDAQAQRPTWIGSNVVGPDYFQVMRIPLLRGRPFTEQDTDHGSAVTIVNDTLANLFWPHEDPIGRRIRQPGGKTFEVVGVVKGGKYNSLDENPPPCAYFPLDPSYARALTFQVRTRISAQRMLGILRDEVGAVDLHAREPGGPTSARHEAVAGQSRKVMGHNLDMNVGRESDGRVVPAKCPNKGGSLSPAEGTEGRRASKENTGQLAATQMQSWGNASAGLRRVREAASEHPCERTRRRQFVCLHGIHRKAHAARSCPRCRRTLQACEHAQSA